MPRLLNGVANWAWLGLALLVGAGHGGLLRAELPPNPLRPVPTANTRDGNAPLAWQWNPEEAGATPPSVVPRQFGQPELLPPPLMASDGAPGAFAGPDLSGDGALHGLVHPWF